VDQEAGSSGRIEDTMSIPEILRWQWQGYPRYHQARGNLLLHIIVIPVFLLGNAAILVAIWQGSGLAAGLGIAAMLTSIALQGVGHRQELVPPEPFKGGLDAVSRLLCEQWVTFPRFVASGGWWRAWRQRVRP
jgi:hypothetical protein